MESITKIGVFCSSSNKLDPIYYEEAARLGKWIGTHKKTLVYGGARCGLMEAIAASVKSSGGKVVGVVPQILIDNNRVSSNIDEQIVTQDLNDRKQKLVEQSDIIIAMPGSVGTLDEIFTVMAANSIGIHDKKVIIWNINGFWSGLFDMLEKMSQTGVVTKPYDQVMIRVNILEEITRIIGG